MDVFDAAAFGIGAPEAAALDPQQRLVLECTAELLLGSASGPRSGSDSSGSSALTLPHPPTAIAAQRLSGPGSDMLVGAFVGVSSADYNKLSLRYGAQASPGAGAGAGGGAVTAFSATGVSLSVAAGRLAFTFNLRGPAMTIDTGEGD